MFEVIRKCSSNPLEDQKKLWDICIFNYLIGNTDNHIKNVSLLYAENLNDIRLAPAYDMVSTMIYESSTENMSLGIGGIYAGTSRASFSSHDPSTSGMTSLLRRTNTRPPSFTLFRKIS